MTTAVGTPTDLDRTHLFIDGAWATPHGSATHRSVEVATGEFLGTAALGDAADIDAAVRAARTALDDGPWGHTSPAERAEVIRAFAGALAQRAPETSTLVSRENGMPIGMSRAVNGGAPVLLLKQYAKVATGLQFETVRPSYSGSTIVRREPVGVVGAITPWNYPLSLAMMKIAPALAAGCTIVLKPSPETALDSYVFADAALEAGFPPGC